MSEKIRIEVKVQGYYFPSHPGLVWHSGNFWLEGRPIKMVYNNGSKALLIAGNGLYLCVCMRLEA